jgi:uncharacterized protein (TIGR03067 family)
MRTPLSCLPALLLVGALAGCADDEPGGSGTPETPCAATELEGTWVGQMHAAVGDSLPTTATFSGCDFSIAVGGTAESYGGVFTLDTMSSPKGLDARMTRTTINQAYVGKTSLCIYEVVGNRLTYAGNAPGAVQRPTSLVPVDSTIVFVLVRQ